MYFSPMHIFWNSINTVERTLRVKKNNTIKSYGQCFWLVRNKQRTPFKIAILVVVSRQNSVKPKTGSTAPSFHSAPIVNYRTFSFIMT